MQRAIRFIERFAGDHRFIFIVVPGELHQEMDQIPLLNPLHTERSSGRYKPIRVFALSEHEPAVYDIAFRDR